MIPQFMSMLLFHARATGGLSARERYLFTSPARPRRVGVISVAAPALSISPARLLVCTDPLTASCQSQLLDGYLTLAPATAPLRFTPA